MEWFTYSALLALRISIKQFFFAGTVSLQHSFTPLNVAYRLLSMFNTDQLTESSLNMRSKEPVFVLTCQVEHPLPYLISSMFVLYVVYQNKCVSSEDLD